MTMTGQTVTLWAGDSLTLAFAVVDADGTAVDLTGGSARWWLGKNNKATDANGGVYVKKTGSISTSTVEVTILPADTKDLKPGTLYHECEVIDASGNVATIAVGSFILQPAIVR